MLGLSLIFVGIVLVMNGVCRFSKVESKSIAVMNLITGSILVLANFLLLNHAISTGEMTHFVNATSGLLFGVTYVFIAANYLFKLDLRPFGWYSLFVAIYAIVMAVVSFISGSIFFGVLWTAWAILWLEGFLELAVKLKIGKVLPYLSIVEGVFAAFIPAILILLECGIVAM